MTDIFNQKAPIKTSSLNISGANFIQLSTDKMSVPMKSSSNNKFSIYSNTNWTVEKDVDWISLDKTSGSNDATVSFSVAQNPDTANVRVGYITVKDANTSSKTIKITQNKNEVWYILYNQRGWNGGSPKKSTAMNGTELGNDILAFTPNISDKHQHWKIEYNANKTYAKLINRATGLNIDYNCRAIDSEANFWWKLQARSGGTNFPGVRIISQNGNIGLHEGAGKVSNYNYELAECFWYLERVPGDIDAVEEAYDALNEDKWYVLYNQRGWTNGNPLKTKAMVGTNLGTELKALAPNPNDHNQQWRVEFSNDGKLAKLINRGTGLSINTECKANNPSENIMWKLQTPSGTTAFPGYRIISQNGTVGIHAGNNTNSERVFNYNYEVSECFWYFADVSGTATNSSSWTIESFFDIYPNPAKYFFNIKIDQNIENASLELEVVLTFGGVEQYLKEGNVLYATKQQSNPLLRCTKYLTKIQ